MLAEKALSRGYGRRVLVEFLYGLSLRQDCFYVKYGTVARDGMYLGRCFLTTDVAAGELCEILKGHPRLMVSLQDDRWFDHFRVDASELDSGIWDDWPEHEVDVAAVLRLAFGRPNEADAVKTMRAVRLPIISLAAHVAPADGSADAWPVVGHIFLAPVTLDGSSAVRALALVTLGIVPAYQQRRFGARLIEAALHRARALGYASVFVCGPRNYFARFGFVPASAFGLARGPASSVDAEHTFMAIELVPGALASVTGAVRYQGESRTF